MVLWIIIYIFLLIHKKNIANNEDIDVSGIMINAGLGEENSWEANYFGTLKNWRDSKRKEISMDKEILLKFMMNERVNNDICLSLLSIVAVWSGNTTNFCKPISFPICIHLYMGYHWSQFLLHFSSYLNPPVISFDQLICLSDWRFGGATFT